MNARWDLRTLPVFVTSYKTAELQSHSAVNSDPSKRLQVGFLQQYITRRTPFHLHDYTRGRSESIDTYTSAASYC